MNGKAILKIRLLFIINTPSQGHECRGNCAYTSLPVSQCLARQDLVLTYTAIKAGNFQSQYVTTENGPSRLTPLTACQE